MDLNVMKEYLVSLGFQLKETEFDKAQKTLETVDKKLEGFASGWAKAFVAAGATIVGVYSAITAATVGLAEHVADADLNYQLFALRMYTSVDAARKLKIATDTLGYSLEDIVWNKELHARFDQLVADQTRLQRHMGPDFEANMKRLRDIRFEFTRLKVEAQYIAMGFISKLFASFGTDAEHFLEKLQGISDWVITNLPYITDVLSSTLKPILKDIALNARDFAEMLQSAASAGMKLIGVVFNDPELKGGALTFEHIARAVQQVAFHTALWVERLFAAIRGLYYISKISSDLMGLDPAAAAADMAAMAKSNTAYNHRLEQLYKNNANLGIGDPYAGKANGMPQQIAASIADQARLLAQQVSQKTGVPANLIWEQWAHETGGFTNRGARELNNLGGVTNPGGVGYRSFGSLSEFADFYAQLIQSQPYRSKGTLMAQTPEDFARALKGAGYYEDTYQNYVRGMKAWQQAYFQSGDTHISVNVHVSQPNATAEQIAKATAKELADSSGKKVQRNIMELSPAY